MHERRIFIVKEKIRRVKLFDFLIEVAFILEIKNENRANSIGAGQLALNL